MPSAFDLHTLDRADALLGEVREAESEYFKSGAIIVDMGLRPGPVNRMRVFVRKALPQDPVRALVGDCIHNIRTTLEYLAHALVEAHSPNPVKPNNIQFPIFDDATKFDASFKGMAEAATSAQAAVRTLQPFAGATPASEHPLSRLQALSNFSKHRKPLTAAVVPTSNGIGIVTLQGANFFLIDALVPGPFKSGDTLATYQVVPTDRFLRVQLEPLLDFALSFAQDSPLPALPLVATLEQISRHVRELVVPTLTPFLG